MNVSLLRSLFASLSHRTKILAPGLAITLGGLALSLSASPSAGQSGWDEPSVLIALIALPGSLLVTWLAHVLNMQRERTTSEMQRESLDTAALKNREDAVTNLLKMLTEQQERSFPIVAENAELRTRLEILERRDKDRDIRERDLITEVTELRTRLSLMGELEEVMGTCAGGHPCPNQRRGLS